MPASRLRLVLLSADAADFEAVAKTWSDAPQAPIELEWCTDVSTALQRLENPHEAPPLFVVGQEHVPDREELRRWQKLVQARAGQLAILQPGDPEAETAEPPPASKGRWQWDLETNAFELEAGWRDWLDLSSSNGSGAVGDFFARMHPEDAEGLREMVTDLLSMDSRTFRGRVRLSPTGGPWWGAELEARVVSDGGSRLQALLGSIRTLDPRQAPSSWNGSGRQVGAGRGRTRTQRIREMIGCVLEREGDLRPASRRMLQDALQLAEALVVLHSGAPDDEIPPQV